MSFSFGIATTTKPFDGLFVTGDNVEIRSLAIGRFDLNGIFVEPMPSEGCVKLVATDGHRLAAHAVKCCVPGIDEGSIIPRHFWHCLKPLIGRKGSPDEVLIGQERDRFAAVSGNVRIIARVIEGSFPAYRQVFPREATSSVLLDRGELLAAVREALPLLPKRTHAIKVELDTSGELRLVSGDAGCWGIGACVDEDLANHEWGFNAKYLREALEGMEGTALTLGVVVQHVGEGVTPQVLSPVVMSDGETAGVALVMPMRL